MSSTCKHNQLMSYQEKFWVLFSKKLSGEASSEEIKELDKLITEYPEWQYAVQSLEDLWKKQHLEKNSILEEDAYLLHLHRMTEQGIPFGEGPDEFPAAGQKKTGIKWYWAAAAVVIIFLAIFGFKKITAGNNKEVAANEINEVSTRPGSKSKVKLPDGTIVLLNAGSRLTYTKDYGKEIREVNLSGEGFFDVRKNKNVPFIIHTSNINIKVLGTVFNVKSYPEDKKTETSLIRGSIEVTIKNRPNDKIILSPSEKLVVENNEAKILEQNKGEEIKGSAHSVVQPEIAVNKINYSLIDSSIAEIQWTENKLVFRDERFAELAVDMGRWYNVTIDITDPLLAEARLTGIFENETIEQALEALKLSTPFLYERKGNNIIIHH